MSYQTSIGVFPDKPSHTATKTPEEKKPSRRPSDAKLKVTVNPLLSLSLNPTSVPKSLKKSNEDQSPKHVVKKESSSGNQAKTVNQAFGKAHPASKRSIGGTSLQPILPHSKSTHFAPESSTEDKVSQITPRIKEPRTPRTPSIATHTFTPTLPSSLDDVEKAAQQLNEFTHFFHEQIKLIQQVFQSSSDQLEKVEEPEGEQIDLAYQMLSNGLSEEWMALRKELDALLLEREKEENDAVEDTEENVGSRSINFHNLGLDFQLGAESTHVTSSGKTSLTKASLSQAKKSIKEEKHLKIAFEFMVPLLLDLQANDPWNQKDSLKKMQQFIPNSFKLDKTLPNIAFNYLNQLFLIGEILKQGSHNIDKLSKGGHPLVNLPIDYAQKFLKAIRDIKEIKKLERDSRKEKVDLYCRQYGTTVTNCAKILLESFNSYLQKSQMQFQMRSIYNNALATQIENDITKRLLTYCDGFNADFERAVKGRFLHLTSDKAECIIPKITRKVRSDKKDDSNEYTQYCHDFLCFLMQNLNIKISSESISEFNPLEKLAETKSIAAVYEALEKEWGKQNETSSECKLEGVFKLLPILRIFNQNNLLAIHKAMFMMQNAVEILDSDEVSHLQIVLPYPFAASKEDKKTPEHMLDRETKHVEIAFKDNKVHLIVKRLNALSFASITSDNTNYYFGDCPVRSSFTISAPLEDMQQWTLEEQCVEIDRPAEISSLLFLRRYSLMITILEAMGIQYHINIQSKVS